MKNINNKTYVGSYLIIEIVFIFIDYIIDTKIYKLVPVNKKLHNSLLIRVLNS